MSINLNNIGGFADKVQDKFSGFVGGVTDSIKGAFSPFTDISKESQGDGGNVFIVFPPEIRSQKDHQPLIEFTAHERNTNPGVTDSNIKKPASGWHRIYLPAPAGLAFTDIGSFNTLSVNTIGAKATAQVLEGEKSVKDTAAGIMSSLKTNADVIAAKMVPGAVGDQLAFSTKKISNPNTNTAFEGNTIRSFTFNFKLVARSQDESDMIRKIHETFRFFSYADASVEGDNYFLSYPAPWTIRFMDSASGQENPYIPPIWSCYLTSLSSTLNSDQNMYFSDNAPLSVELALTFQETRVLNRTDLLEMKNDITRGIVGGKASTLPPSKVSGPNITRIGGN